MVWNNALVPSDRSDRSDGSELFSAGGGRDAIHFISIQISKRGTKAVFIRIKKYYCGMGGHGSFI